MIGPGEIEFIGLAGNERIPYDRVADLVDELIDDVNETATDELIDMIMDERITVEEWKRTFAAVLKDLFITLAILGGGALLTRWGSIEAQLRIQYGYLDRFAEQIAAGDLTGAEIRRRARMYVNSARQGFWRQLDQQAAELGYTEERWYAIGDDRTCGPCMEADMMGWQPLGTFAEPGSGTVLRSPTTMCQGLTNCRCRKVYQ